MPFIRVVTESKFVSSGSVYSVDTGDSLILNQGVSLATSGSSDSAVYGYSSTHITLNGAVSGVRGAYINADATVTIGASGLASATYAGIQSGDRAVIINHGDVFGNYIGLNISGNNSTITNTGKIACGPSGYGAIYIEFETGTRLDNSGVIEARSPNQFSYSSVGTGVDVIKNTGTIVGNVSLGGGSDNFNSTKGKVYGTIDGGAGDDKIYGSMLADRLTGGADADTFYFGTKPNSKFVDHITDFVHGQDHIGIDDAVFRGVSASLLSRQFHDITHAAQQADDRILYNHDKGTLYYDADGLGGTKPVLFAVLDKVGGVVPTLTHHDFLVF